MTADSDSVSIVPTLIESLLDESIERNVELGRYARFYSTIVDTLTIVGRGRRKFLCYE